MDGWMDGWMNRIEQKTLFNHGNFIKFTYVIIKHRKSVLLKSREAYK